MQDLRNKLFRHFKGHYFIVTDEAEFGDSELFVVYTSTMSGRTYICPKSEFYEVVPDSEENPTGQKYRFERVLDYENQLNMITTDRLVKELLSRHDSPIKGLDIEGIKDVKIFLSEYVVGIVESDYCEDGKVNEIFRSVNAYDTFEWAKAKLDKLGGRYEIIKRVYVRL